VTASLSPFFGSSRAGGFSEGQTAIGNAEAMTVYSQGVVINEIGTTCAPPSQDSIDHQRIPFDLRDEAKGLLGLWFVRRGLGDGSHKCAGDVARHKGGKDAKFRCSSVAISCRQRSSTQQDQKSAACEQAHHSSPSANMMAAVSFA